MDTTARDIVQQFKKERANLLPILLKVQEADKCISPEAILEISRYLDISENDIYSTASFYKRFTFSAAESSAAVPEAAVCDAAPRTGEVRIALRNVGRIDPEKIDDYIANEGYKGLAEAIKMGPEGAVEEVVRSGLRGRGGAGFPAAEKWKGCRAAEGSEVKYLICDAVEGDPAACSCRVLLESDPHAVLEGMVIGAFATGATQGIICINGGYTQAIARVRTALKQMEEKKYLGENILDSGFSFTIEIAEGLAFVCGEETSLVASLEGRRGMPTVRPPFPEAVGFNGAPTVINNAETFAHVSAIFQKGAAWYVSCGSDKSKGTKTFTLAGDIAKPGLIEVPMGTPLKTVINDIGGGTANGRQLKAVQVGGPTGGWIAADKLDTPLDFEDMEAAGSIIGSGSLVVADDSHCAVELADKVLGFIETESCGKCVYCREGTMQLAEIVKDITEGRGEQDDLSILVDLGEAMKQGAFCSFGKTAPNPVLTTIRDFRDEYEAHIKERRCPAKVCKKLETSSEG